ncbi:3-phosphoshikimate 1-carboxyvinyltransferase [Deinococcus sp. KNUC1210]|uniref:3-phosphoshikimate 1-carboxyvinyltransferase n=1 Tax=Deinococcus sp. KNUC1210 TaxID=2917691 RepID=UPI001EF10A13|nr:3-phosphoshikimate 1-carboxyvinyltransferase [Deinococcus sp. KNUC1210]ULH15054.1 3-phosphoshikimate 1-carboxyvinyltransferase [Deinococcus sp. KNUC1210]
MTTPASQHAPHADGMPDSFDVVVHPARELRGTLRAQPSKNYTTRYLLAAALTAGEVRVVGVATSEDAGAMLRCLQAWGAGVELIGDDAVIRGFGAKPGADVTLNPGNAGAVARFLMGVSVLTTGTRFVTDYPDSLGKRPQGDLLEALSRLGAQVSSQDGKFPISLSGPVRGGALEVSAEKSSQYASALMFLAPLLPAGLDLHLTGDIKSHAPLRQTLDTLSAFGIRAIANNNLSRISIPGAQAYQASRIMVPGDYPGSAAILAAAALLPGDVRLSNLRENDLQGEREAVNVLREMGADIVRTGDSLTVHGGQPLRAVTRDGDGFTDAVQALTATAAFAEGQTTWENVYTLRLKECDRISDTRRELEKLGFRAAETNDSLSISGAASVAGGVTADGHGDHRMIMLLTLIGLRATSPIRITGAHHIRKSYPMFFRHLEELGASFEYVAATRD